MRSESEAFRAMYRELDDLRAALLDSRRQLAALRTERKMQEARKRQIVSMLRERYEHEGEQKALRAELAKVAAERDDALARNQALTSVRSAENIGQTACEDLLRAEIVSLRAERSRLVTERDALLRAAQAKPLRTVEETMAGQAGVLAALAPHDRATPPTAELDEARAEAESAAIELNQLRQEVTTLRGKSASLASPKNGANDPCAACGCDRVFHQIGTGNGVPVGQPYCDDRYAAPCDCRGFVKRVVTAPPTTVQLGGHRMDADGGPVCRCGKPSTHESGWCGACGVVSSPASDPFAAIKSDVESLWAVLSRHADAIAELRGKAGDRG